MQSLFLEPATASRPDAGPWFAPLVHGERGRIDAITRTLSGSPTPRAGLGGALAIHVARSYGTRRWQEAAKVAVAVIESVDRRVHAPPSDDPSRALWLRGDATRLRRVWDGLFRRDAALLHRVLDRIGGGHQGDDALPEAVLFLRGAVAAGVLCGDVDDATHARLDRFATALGLRIELAYGALDGSGWRGAWQAVGVESAWPADPRREALEEARRLRAELPDGDLAERLDACLDALPAHLPDVRGFRAWRPRPSPLARVVADPLEDAIAAAVSTGARPLARALRYLQGQGGKRVRPAIVRAAALAAGGTDGDALAPAALLEWLHQASLVIDDILDEARIRRGAPTLHHATDAPFALGVAGWVLVRVAIAARSLDDGVRTALFDAATTLADGQRQELAHTGDDQLPVAQYYRIIEAKTARLFGCAAVLGARAARADAATVQALGRYGREAGLAFQIVDDVLDFFGDERDLGKRPGTDLRAGKITLPLLLLRDGLDPAGRETLAAVLHSPSDARRAAFPWVLERMTALGIEADALARARVHRDRALSALESLPAGPGRDALAALADRIVERRR